MSEKKIYWDQGWHGIKDKHRKAWRAAYPSVKIDTELAAMDQWLWANPNRRKKNYPCFIVNWFKRCQDKGGASNLRATAIHCSGTYRPPTPLSRDEIEKRTKENQKPGGACDQVAALLTEWRNGRTKSSKASESYKKN